MGDFVTSFDEYRMDIAAVDTGGPENPSIPILDTRPGPNANVGLGQADINQYGRNAQLDIGLILNGLSSVKVTLWLLAEPNRAKLQSATAGSSSSSSSSSGPATGWWVKVEDKTVSTSSLWVVKDIPPGQYRIEVNTLTGGGTLSIVEGHAA